MSACHFNVLQTRRIVRAAFGLLRAVVVAAAVAACGPVSSACAESPIKIAAIFSLTGPAAAANAASLEGVRWAVEEINVAGGVLGRKLELIELDNLGTPIGSKVAADLAAEMRVAAILGPSWSSHSMAVARVAQAHKIPMISNVSTHPDLTRIGDCIFRVCYDDALQGRALAQFARTHLNARSAVICLDMASDYSMGLGNSFASAFEMLGGQVLKRIAYKPRQSNFRQTAALIKEFEPDLLFVPGYDESGAIISEAIRMGVRAIPLGGDGWDSELFFQKGGHRIAEGYFSTHWSGAIQESRSLAFVSKFAGRGALVAQAALSYDATHVLVDAMRRAGITHGDALRAALAETRDFKGVTGRITFDQQGDPLKSLVIMRIVNGRPDYLTQVHQE
jgi:branched-chain amino acid transport system substrate-binding protein